MGVAQEKVMLLETCKSWFPNSQQVLSGQHQPLYSGQLLGKAELCTVTSYVDTTMAPLVDSHRVSGQLEQGRALAR